MSGLLVLSGRRPRRSTGSGGDGLWCNDGARGRCGVDHQWHQQRPGCAIESVAAHCRVSGAELRIAELDADDESTPSAVDYSASATSTSAPKAITRKTSANKSTPSGTVDCSADELRPPDRQAAPGTQEAQHLPAVVDQRLGSNLHGEGDQEELRVGDRFGSDRIWSTADCPSLVKSISRKLRAEHAVAWSLTWDGKRSKPDCKSARKVLRPGTYVAAQLAGAAPVELRMIVDE